MGDISKIEWLNGGHTASPWHGCAEVHVGCENCYAKTMAKRNPGTLGVWGTEGTRVMSASFKANCLKWNKAAAKRGVIETVFPSICDIFEEWNGPILDSRGRKLYRCPQCEWGDELDEQAKLCQDCDRHEAILLLTMDDLRRDLFALIDECQSLRFLLLTKRPQNVRQMWPKLGFPDAGIPGTLGRYRRLENVSVLTSVSDQETADKMIPELLWCRDLVPTLGVSFEPLLGPIECKFAMPWRINDGRLNASLDWGIIGGESGHGARPCNINWIRSLRDQFKESGVACFVKQLGGNVEWNVHPGDGLPLHQYLDDKKGGNMEEWPEDLRVRQYPKSMRWFP